MGGNPAESRTYDESSKNKLTEIIPRVCSQSMKTTHPHIEILENHCWQADQSQGVQLAKRAKAEGKKTIPLAELSKTSEPRRTIEEHFEGRRPARLDEAHITRIYGMGHDDDDEVTYYVDLSIPE